MVSSNAVQLHERVVKRDVVAAVFRRAVDGEDNSIELMQEIRQDVFLAAADKLGLHFITYLIFSLVKHDVLFLSE